MKYFAYFFITMCITCLAPFCWSADTLSKIYELSLNNDSQLLAAKAEYLAKKESKNINRAALLPSVIAVAKYKEGETKGSATRVLGAGGSIFGTKGNNDRDEKSYRVSLTQPIFDMPAWFDFQTGVKLSHEAKSKFSADRQSHIIRCAESYYAVLRAQENLKNIIEEEEALRKQFQQINNRFNVGLSTMTEIYEAQVALNNAEVSTLDAQAKLVLVFDGLSILTGKNHDILAGLKQDLPIMKPEPLDRKQWVQFAVNNNYSLKAARHAQEAAEQSAKSKKYAHLPKLEGSMSFYDDRSDEYFSGTDLNTSTGFSSPSESNQIGRNIGIELSLPIFTGGLISAERRQAMQEFIKLREIWIGKKKSIIQETKSKHLQVLTNIARVKARQRALDSAKKAMASNEESYETGARDISDVLVSKQNYHQAKRDYADSRYDYIISLLRLKEVAGQLSPQDLFDLDGWLDPKINIMKSLN
jgi:outer membrane protein